MRIIAIILFSLIALSSCIKEPDLCEGVTCINGGVCINGDCDCLTGYEGPDCGKQNTPSIIYIKDIKVLKFPATNENGDSWDSMSRADIYFSISNNGALIYGPGGPNYSWPNADPSRERLFRYMEKCPLAEYNDIHTISLFDYDKNSTDDFMGYKTFKPYSMTNNFPDTIWLGRGTDLVFIVGFSYEFN